VLFVLLLKNFFTRKFIFVTTLFTAEAVCKRVDPDWRLDHLNRMRGAVGHDFLSDKSIKEQAAWAEAA
jgi:hypothetical protein